MMRAFSFVGGMMWISAAIADPAVDFGRFWGAVLAIEDRCEQYLVRTDAIMGSHLSQKDYRHAESLVDGERVKAGRLVERLGCDRAAEEAAKLSGKSFFEVWELAE